MGSAGLPSPVCLSGPGGSSPAEDRSWPPQSNISGLRRSMRPQVTGIVLERSLAEVDASGRAQIRKHGQHQECFPTRRNTKSAAAWHAMLGRASVYSVALRQPRSRGTRQCRNMADQIEGTSPSQGLVHHLPNVVGNPKHPANIQPTLAGLDSDTIEHPLLVWANARQPRSITHPSRAGWSECNRCCPAPAKVGEFPGKGRSRTGRIWPNIRTQWPLSHHADPSSPRTRRRTLHPQDHLTPPRLAKPAR